MTIDDIKQYLTNYKPSYESIEIVKRARILLLLGVAGAGKDTVKNSLLSSNYYSPIVSYTTRSIRFDNNKPEVDGVDYYFTNLDSVKRMIDNKYFIEAKIVHGDTVYGTTASELKRITDCNKIAINDINIDGVIDYLNIHGDIKAVFLVPPSYDVWIERLKKRYKTVDEFNSEWPKRLNSAKMEFSRALEEDRFLFVINDNLEGVVSLINELLFDDSITTDDSEARQVAKSILSKLVL